MQKAPVNHSATPSIFLAVHTRRLALFKPGTR